MNQIRPACGLPFCQNPKEREIGLSSGLRITAVVLGILAVIVGTLILINIPELSHLSTPVGWSLVSIGTLLTLVGISIKCVKNKCPIGNKVVEEEPTQEQQRNEIFESDVGINHSNKEGKEGAEIQKNNPNALTNPLQGNAIVSKKTSFIRDNLETQLTSYMANAPYLKLPNKPVGFEDLAAATAAITSFSAGPTIGVHIRLRVTHLATDVSYDRRGEYQQTETEFSSKQPFILPIIVWRQYTNDNVWVLTSKRYPCIEHRNGPFPVGNILADGTYSFCADSFLTQKVFEQFVNTKRQDDLPSAYRHNLGWILLRLFNGKDLEIRERRTDCLYNSFDDPAVGYWHISIDR